VSSIESQLNACVYIDQWLDTCGIDSATECHFPIDRAIGFYVEHAGLCLEHTMYRAMLSIIDCLDEPLKVTTHSDKSSAGSDFFALLQSG